MRPNQEQQAAMKYRRTEAKEFARTHMKGIWAAALVPFAEDLSIDEKGFRANLRWRSWSTRSAARRA